MRRALIFLIGLEDGWKNPIDLGATINFEDDALMDAYDMGVFVGQDLRTALHCLKAAIHTQPHNLS